MSTADEIEKLHSLKERGIISTPEYEARKANVLRDTLTSSLSPSEPDPLASATPTVKPEAPRKWVEWVVGISIVAGLWAASGGLNRIVSGNPASSASADFPCVEELCIGGDIDKLKAIRWIVEDDGALPSDWQKFIGLDGATIERLMINPPVACTSSEPLSGVFRSKSGFPTRVQVKLLVNGADVAQQRWLVSYIERVYPGLEWSDTMEMREKLEEKYAAFIFSYQKAQQVMVMAATENHGHLPPYADVSQNGSDPLSLRLFGAEIGTWHPAGYERHPECGGRGNAPLTTE